MIVSCSSSERSEVRVSITARTYASTRARESCRLWFYKIDAFLFLIQFDMYLNHFVAFLVVSSLTQTTELKAFYRSGQTLL